jgi:hypothetical protein
MELIVRAHELWKLGSFYGTSLLECSQDSV